MKAIILEEILEKSFYNNNIPKPIHTLAEITQKAVKEAMKEACKQTLELAAENADIGICQNDGGCPYIQESHFIDKQSILDTINQIN